MAEAIGRQLLVGKAECCQCHADSLLLGHTGKDETVRNTEKLIELYLILI
jgi:hypothetical protein